MREVCIAFRYACVVGEGKESTLAGGVDLLAKELPDAKVLVLPDGHASHIVAQDQFIDEFEKFIAIMGNL